MISAFRFDDEREILQVRSRRSNRVHHFRCDPADYKEFLRAPSRGRFLAKLERVKTRRRLRLLPH